MQDAEKYLYLMYSNKICSELYFNNEMEEDINDMATINSYINSKSEVYSTKLW